MKSIVVHYQEIALKGKNRPWFVARLVRNLKEATKDLGLKGVRVLPGYYRLCRRMGTEAVKRFAVSRLS